MISFAPSLGTGVAASGKAWVKALTNFSDNEEGLVTCLRTSHVKIHSEQDLAWTLDGEFGGDHREVEVTNCHQAITIVYGA